MVNALRSSHLDGLGSSGQFSLCSFLVAGLNCGVYLLDSGLNAGTDSFCLLYTSAVTKEEINAAMKAASTESFGYNTDEIVSSDIVGLSLIHICTGQ